MSPRTLTLASVALFAVAGCAGDIYDGNLTTPSLLAVSADKVGVGESLDFIGQDFLSGSDGYTELHITGTFTSLKGEQSGVDMTVHPNWMAASRLQWTNVGPFDVPFGSGKETGAFSGVVTPVNVSPRREHSTGDGLPIELTIGPSIIVTDLQPLDSGCEAPAKRLLGGFPYRIQVEALDFDPVTFTYQLVGEMGSDTPRLYRQPAVNGGAVLGEDFPLLLAPVPDGTTFYAVQLIVTARNAKGDEISTNYSLGVHRPIEYIDYGKPEIAQIEAAKPVSGCIAGGFNGQHVEYSESTADTRSRQVNYNWNDTFTTEHSSNYSTSHEERHGVNTSFTQTADQSWETNWNGSFNHGVNGGINVFGVVNGGGSAEWANSKGGGYHHGASTSNTVGHDFSTADTESWAETNSESHSVAVGSGSFYEVSSTDTISRSTSGDVIPGLYGMWYRQATRLVRPGAVVLYNLCGEPWKVADAQFEDYVWAAALAQGPKCLPESTLPKAECRIFSLPVVDPLASRTSRRRRSHPRSTPRSFRR